MTASLAILVTVAALIALLRWAIHQGFRVPRPVPGPSPAQWGLSARDVRLPTANGKSLRGWLLPAGPDPAPAVLLMHGWGADATSLLPLAKPLHAHGLTLLLLDARSHGRSDGDSFASMPRFAEDIAAGLNWLKDQDAVDSHRLAVVGHSVGGAAALLAASRRDDLSAVVSLSAFDHPERVMRTYLARAHVPYRPVGWLICRYVERVIGHRFDHIAPVTTIAKIRCPVLIGHGADDTLVPCAAAHAIHARAGDQATLRILEDTDHEQPASFDTLAAILADFLVPRLIRP